jgi:hypothetical protein
LESAEERITYYAFGLLEESYDFIPGAVSTRIQGYAAVYIYYT